jgi:hypothetical protein
MAVTPFHSARAFVLQAPLRRLGVARRHHALARGQDREAAVEHDPLHALGRLAELPLEVASRGVDRHHVTE